MDIRRIYLPLDEAAYLPDPAEPVDRWFQAGNASNVQTICRLIGDLAPDAECVIDPFAGAGSTAAAARTLRKPFFGVEQDPVLATACLAKLHASPRHAGLLAGTPSMDDLEALDRTLAGIGNRTNGALARDLSALAVICYLSARWGRPLTAEQLTADLASVPPPHPDGRAVRGDATTAAAWQLARIPRRPSVVYTSPPFRTSSWALDAPALVRQSAVELLQSAGLDSGSPARPFTSYSELTLAMLRQALPYLAHSTVIIECEPDDDKFDPAESVLERIIDEFGATVRRVQLLESESFFLRGRFSLLVFDV